MYATRTPRAPAGRDPPPLDVVDERCMTAERRDTASRIPDLVQGKPLRRRTSEDCIMLGTERTVICEQNAAPSSH